METGDILISKNKDIVSSSYESTRKFSDRNTHTSLIIMAILQKTVDVKITKFNIDHFKAKGYDAVDGYNITVDVDDLSPGSGIKVLVKCDYCHKKILKSYRDYKRTEGNVCCLDCRKDKFAKTNIEKYGVACSLRNPLIHAKATETLMNKYGVEYPLLSEEIRKKCTKTFQEKYNSNSYRLTHDDISKIMKRQQTEYGVCSKEQKEIHKLFGGILNARMGRYIIDILFNDEKIAFEYNGGGHYLGVIHGSYTMDEFKEREKKRYNFIIDNGYKCFVIENQKYGLPSNDKLLEIKERGFNVLKRQNDVCVYIYDIVNKSENLLKSSDL